MTKEFSPRRLDVKAFAQAGARLEGHESLLAYERLAQEAQGLHPDLRVDWEAVGALWRQRAAPAKSGCTCVRMACSPCTASAAWVRWMCRWMWIARSASWPMKAPLKHWR